jgi:23S rRNA (uracil1939-C5)-methyltransferase
MKEGAIVELDIDGVDDEGRGRGVVDDWDVAVRGGLPGDRVRARVERPFPARSLVQARCLSILAPGSLHAPRSCPHGAPCPACPLEGVDAGFAHAWKRGRVEHALMDAGLPLVASDVRAPASPRQKVKLTAGMEDGALRLGMYVPHTHVLVDADLCPHVHPAVRAAVRRLRPTLAHLSIAPHLRAVIVRSFVEGAGVVLVVERDVGEQAWAALRSTVDGSPIVHVAIRTLARGDGASDNSLLSGDVVRTEGPSRSTPLEGGPPAEVDAFCQPDADLARALYDRVAAFLVGDAVAGPLAAIDPTTPATGPRVATYVDLYAGTGGFSRALLARGARDVIAVERAAANAKTLATLPLRALTMTVEDAIPVLAASASDGAPLEGIVADPARRGLGPVAAPISRLGARRVAVVACDPDAGARDAKVFVDAGYTLVDVEPWDLFGPAVDVEAVFLLERRSR